MSDLIFGQSTNDALKDARGEMSADLFAIQLSWLKDKWHQLNDSDEKRLACSLIFRKLSPINTAIIADSLTFFKANYEKAFLDDLGKPLLWACLCGSQKIADFLLEKLNRSYTSDEDVLVYASASNNLRWVEEIGRAVYEANADKEMPDIFLCTEFEMRAALHKIFFPSSAAEIERPKF